MKTLKEQAAELLADDIRAYGVVYNNPVQQFLRELAEAPEPESIGYAIIMPNRATRIWFGDRENSELWREREGVTQELTPLYTAPPAPSLPESLTDLHSDDLAVDRFAAAMKAKMAKSRDYGRHGWDNPEICDANILRMFLVNHIEKGDPVDVGNFAMMLFNRNETTSQRDADNLKDAPIEPPAELVRDAERYRWLRRRICFSGNGDGTASMHVINLPNAARFPEVGQLEAGADAAIDAAIERDKLKGGEA